MMPLAIQATMLDLLILLLALTFLAVIAAGMVRGFTVVIREIYLIARYAADRLWARLK